jgi:hypothetical protein
VRRLAAVGCSPEHSAPVQCFLTEPAYVLARLYAECGLLVSLSGARLDLPGRFTSAQGAGLDDLGQLTEAVDELLERSFRDRCPAVHMDGAYETVLARAHGATISRWLLPPYQSATEQVCRRFLAGLRRLLGLDSRPDHSPACAGDQCRRSGKVLG